MSNQKRKNGPRKRERESRPRKSSQVIMSNQKRKKGQTLCARENENHKNKKKTQPIKEGYEKIEFWKMGWRKVNSPIGNVVGGRKKRRLKVFMP